MFTQKNKTRLALAKIKCFIRFLALFMIASSVQAGGDKIVKVDTGRGYSIESKIEIPEGVKGKLPVLVIAPGQGYHMDLPIITALSNKALENGVISVRFNWSYYTAGGKPSEELSTEKQDMKDVLKYVKSLPNVDQSKVMLAGKSLGTIVGYSVFLENKDLFSLYLITPVCTWYWDKQGNEVEPFSVAKDKYPDFDKTTRPIHITQGNNDPLCRVNMLYPFLSSSKGNVSATVFAGDHGLNIGSWKDPAYTERNGNNIKMAVDATAHWMNIHLDK